MQFQESGTDGPWNEFLATYRPLIESAVRQAGTPSDRVDDAVQEVLLQLIRVLPTFDYSRERGFFRHWLRRVSLNKAHDLQRAAKRHERTGCHLTPLSGREERDAVWTQAFQTQLIELALRTIRPSLREKTWLCFVQHVQQGHPAAQVALSLGLSENAVYINSSRVLARLREFCALHGEEIRDDGTLLP